MEIREAVLQLIAAHDGKWSWYQIERGLSARSINSEGRLMSIINDLISDNLIVAVPSSIASQSMYELTDAGKMALSSTT
jgi:hypothetical protein